jgi:uridine kinase
MKSKPTLIVIDGPMGAGKTTVSKLLQTKMYQNKGYTALLSLDRIKYFVSGYKLDSKYHLNLASDIGIVMVKEYIKKGVNVIVEKAFTNKEFLVQFSKPLGKLKPLIYQIEAPEEIRLKRVMNRDVPLESKRPPKSKFMRNSKHYLEYKYTKAKVFDSSKLTSLQIVNRIMKEIK